MSLFSNSGRVSPVTWVVAVCTTLTDAVSRWRSSPWRGRSLNSKCKVTIFRFEIASLASTHSFSSGASPLEKGWTESTSPFGSPSIPKITPTEDLVFLLRNFNAHVDIDSETSKGMIVRRPPGSQPKLCTVRDWPKRTLRSSIRVSMHELGTSTF